jgi:2-polyprenyl-3-methyl-5-hydroxy-6-metoxy-1,4-benzoquinol methylase
MCGDDTKHHELLGQRFNCTQGFNPRSKKGITTSVLRCSKCGLVYNQPMPIPANIGDHYNMDISEYWQKPDDLYSQDHFNDELKIFEKLSGSVKMGMKALDVGSGLGQTVVALTKAGFDTIGIEPSLSFYENAILYSKLPKNRFINNSFEDQKLKDNEYDLITCPNVIEHVYDPGKNILKCIKALKTGGLLYICVPSSNWLKTAIINFFYKLTLSGYVTNTSPMHPPFHLHEFTKKAFYEHANKNQYEVELIRIFPDSIINFPIIKNIFMFYTKLLGKGLRMDVWIRKVDSK